MKKFIVITVLLFAHTTAFCMNMDDALYALAKHSYIALKQVLTMPNKELFTHEKSITIYQVPTVNGNVEQQTRQAMQEIVKKLGNLGLSLEDVTKCHMYTQTASGFEKSLSVLKETYPSLQRKLNSEVTELPKSCEVAFTIKAHRAHKKKAARL